MSMFDITCRLREMDKRRRLIRAYLALAAARERGDLSQPRDNRANLHELLQGMFGPGVEVIGHEPEPEVPGTKH